MQSIFERTLPDEKSIEKVISKIRETKDCNNKRDRVALNQALKNQFVLELIKVRIANGVIKIKTFRSTYLKEYVKSKLIKFIVIKLLRTPSKEKTLIGVVLLLVTMLFSLSINWEKLMLQL